MIRILSYFLGNIIGLLVAITYIPGFEISKNLTDLVIVTTLLTVGNLIVRPILKTILAPLIWLSLGLFTIVINAAILFGVDFMSDLITINGLSALIYGTLLISLSVGCVRILLRFILAKKPANP